MAVCSLAITAFYGAVAQGLRIVKTAREQALASQLLEQRFEALRARKFWTTVTTKSGLANALEEPVASAAGLAEVSESFRVGPYPGEKVAFTVTRRADGRVSQTGSSLPSTQGSVWVTGVVTWRSGAKTTRSRSISSVLTRGGL